MAIHPVQVVPVDALQPHPRNYRTHPDDQLEHIVQSIKSHGFYRNVVIARDGTILAGHGVVLAAHRLGLADIPVIRLDIAADDPRAIQVLAGDNEIANLGEVDDRALTELLRELVDEDWDLLLGTGFDQAQLAALLLVTRPSSEIPDANAASEWIGMPGFEAGEQDWRIVVSFDTDEDRQRFVDEYQFNLRYKTDKRSWSMHWPDKERRDLKSVEYQ